MIKGICESVLNRVYDFCDMTDEELRCKFFQKLQECIDLCNNTNEIVEWLKNEGLEKEVNELLSQWLEDGTLETLINSDLLDIMKEELTTKINENKEAIEVINNQINTIKNDIEKIKIDITELKSNEV